jgi:hypothetical protein
MAIGLASGYEGRLIGFWNPSAVAQRPSGRSYQSGEWTKGALSESSQREQVTPDRRKENMMPPVKKAGAAAKKAATVATPAKKTASSKKAAAPAN